MEYRLVMDVYCRFYASHYLAAAVLTAFAGQWRFCHAGCCHTVAAMDNLIICLSLPAARATFYSRIHNGIRRYWLASLPTYTACLAATGYHSYPYLSTFWGSYCSSCLAFIARNARTARAVTGGRLLQRVIFFNEARWFEHKHRPRTMPLPGGLVWTLRRCAVQPAVPSRAALAAFLPLRLLYGGWQRTAA